MRDVKLLSSESTTRYKINDQIVKTSIKLLQCSMNGILRFRVYSNLLINEIENMHNTAWNSD